MEGLRRPGQPGSTPGRKPHVYLPLQQLSSRNKSPVPTSRSTSKRQSTRPGSASGEQNSSSRPCQEHSFLTDVADVRQMEQGLLQLLDDFHSGKLQAFGQECSFEKMDQIREQQERLARLHFEMDGQQELQGVESAESRETASKNLTRLMDNLEELCSSIQNLQKEQPNNHP